MSNKRRNGLMNHCPAMSCNIMQLWPSGGSQDGASWLTLITMENSGENTKSNYLRLLKSKWDQKYRRTVVKTWIMTQNRGEFHRVVGFLVLFCFFLFFSAFSPVFWPDVGPNQSCQAGVGSKTERNPLFVASGVGKEAPNTKGWGVGGGEIP